MASDHNYYKASIGRTNYFWESTSTNRADEVYPDAQPLQAEVPVRKLHVLAEL